MVEFFYICKGIIVLQISKILALKLLNRRYPNAIRFITLIKLLVPSNFPLEYECVNELIIELQCYLSFFKDVCITVAMCL